MTERTIGFWMGVNACLLYVNLCTLAVDGSAWNLAGALGALVGLCVGMILKGKPA